MTEQVIQGLIQFVKSAKNLVLDQAPDVAKQMVLLARVEYCTTYSFLVILVIIAYLIFKRLVKKAEESGDEGYEVVAFLLAGIAFAIFLGIFFPNLRSLLSCFFAPKVYLLETLTSMVKK